MKNKVHSLNTLLAASFALFCISPLSTAETAKQHMVEVVSPDGSSRELAQRDVYGPITLKDTLWSIATRYRPSNDVTVHQVTVAIYKLNPHAFKNGNINAIIAGGAIRIPTEADIKKVSHREAMRLLSAKPKKKKKTVSTRSDGKKVVKYSPKSSGSTKGSAKRVSMSQYKSLMDELAQLNALVKRQNAEIKEYQSNIVLLEKELAAKSFPIESGDDDSVDAQDKILHLTEVNHALKMKAKEFDTKVAAMQAELDKAHAALSDLKQQLKANENQLAIAAELKEEPQEEELSSTGDDLYSQLVAKPLNLLMMVVVYTLLLLVIVVLVLRIRGKKEIDEQEKDLAESPLGVMDDEDNQFDSLLSDEIEDDTQVTEKQTADLEPELNAVDLEEPTDDLEELSSFDDFEASPEPIEEVDLNADLTEELEDSLEADFAQEMTEEPAELAAEVNDELDVSDSLSSVELSDFDEMDDAPDLVPAPTSESFSIPTDELEADLDFDIESSLGEGAALEEQEQEQELDALDFPSKSETSVEVDSDMDVDQEKATGEGAEIEAELELDPELVSGGELSEEEPELSLEIEPEPALEMDTDLEPELELDLAELEPQESSSGKPKDEKFVDIEDLMADSEEESSDADPYDGPSLDVGLDEFPDLLSEHEDVDVDADASGVNTQLDLARAYLEIDDKSGAKAILEEVLAKGNEAQVEEAKSLLAKIG